MYTLALSIKNPHPEDVVLIYPQSELVMPVISGFFGIMQ